MKPLVSWHYVIRIKKQYQTHSCNLPAISYSNYVTLDTAMNSISVIAQGWCLHPGQLVKHDCKAPCPGLKQKKTTSTVHKQAGIPFSARSTPCSLPQCHKFLVVALDRSHRPRTTFSPKYWRASGLFLERCFLGEMGGEKEKFTQILSRKEKTHLGMV